MLVLSRIVWEQVVVPWVLCPAEINDLLPPPAMVSCVFATAEAMFPLVALASRAVLLLQSKCHCSSRHYHAVEAAAEALSPRCLGWLIRSKSSRRMGEGGYCCWWESEVKRAGGSGVRQQLPSAPSPGDGDGDETHAERERELERRRRKAKEQVAVLEGMCLGGHLKLAQRFVENRCECWREENGETSGCSAAPPKVWVLWPGIGGGDKSITGSSLGKVVGDTAIHDELRFFSILDSSRMGENGSGPLCYEFWGDMGVFHIMKEVSVIGHLDVLKWLVLNVKEINQWHNTVLQDCLTEAFLNGHLHILKWLVGTFDLDELVDQMGLACSFKPTKGRVSDVKLFVETFPHWNFSRSQDLAEAATSCQGCSAEAIIEVCQWLKDRFSLSASAFLPSVTRNCALAKNAKVTQWALSDVTDRGTLEELWRRTCVEIGDVELGKWVVEEKGVAPTTDNFMVACSGNHDNVEFLKWLLQNVGGDLCQDDLVGALHRALVASLKQGGGLTTFDLVEHKE
ncbi:hypothetical protein Pelo_18392 [Pelomyxa schiedti]|nr:hypothetical protein Pelo_18392 [Pelomyxa schiedti]